MEPTRAEERELQQINDDGDDIIRWFERVAETAVSVQTQTLRRILELNWGVEYLKKWFKDTKAQDFSDSELESLYTSLVPLATHKDFEPFITRIAEGETGPILTQQPILALSRTSGTTEGGYKYVPFTSHYAQTMTKVGSLGNAHALRAYPTREVGKILGFLHCYKKYKTKGGLTVGSVSSHIFGSQEFKTNQENSKLTLCSPLEVIFGEDYKQATYCHLLLGLFFSDQVETLTSIFAYTLVQAFSDFEELWEELCCDIREGTLSPRITCPKLRNSVLDIISSNQSLASKIEAICKDLGGSGWHGILPMLWPNAKSIRCIITGSMQPYVKKLKHYAGDLPLVGSSYVCSESCIGANIDPSSSPENVTFAIAPDASYFEFIPQSNGNSSSNENDVDCPIPLSGVKVGQEYELVLTTFGGLYRYRLGDIVEVVGFHKTTPKLKFIRRGKMVLNITSEKISETELAMVLEKASELLVKSNVEIVDYTSHAEVVNQPGHYIIYLEIKGEVDESVLRECCTEMDASFMQMDYITSRKFKSIGPLELRILSKGSFKKLVDHFVLNGGTASQFKTPRSTNHPGILEILNACTIKRFHSTAFD